MTTETHNLSGLVAENVRALMARTRTKQSELADVLHMTQGAVSKKVNGDRPFSLDEIDAVADFFGVPVQSLFDPPRALPFRGRVTSSLTLQYGIDSSITHAIDQLERLANEGAYA